MRRKKERKKDQVEGEGCARNIQLESETHIHDHNNVNRWRDELSVYALLYFLLYCVCIIIATLVVLCHETFTTIVTMT